MVAHWGDLLVTGLLATVSVPSVCGQVFTREILVPPGTQNNSSVKEANIMEHSEPIYI